MNVANRPRRPSVAKQSKHNSNPAKPPNKPRPRAGAGLYINDCITSCFMLITRILTQLDIVDQVAQYIGIPNVGQALELGAF
jgi:hypothetical protein